MEDGYPDTREELEAWAPHWPAFDPVQWIQIPQQCNWKTRIEKYLGRFHFPRNHPSFSTGIVKPETHDIQPQDNCLRHTAECQNLDRRAYPATRAPLRTPVAQQST